MRMIPEWASRTRIQSGRTSPWTLVRSLVVGAALLLLALLVWALLRRPAPTIVTIIVRPPTVQPVSAPPASAPVPQPRPAPVPPVSTRPAATPVPPAPPAPPVVPTHPVIAPAPPTLPTPPAPPKPPAPVVKSRPVIEMVFALDTTGSMGGMLDSARQRIWGIVNKVMQSPSHPIVRIGLVAYRDHGDAYLTQVLPITGDLDSVYTTLMGYQADGGGDIPEDVRQALADAVQKAGWTPDSGSNTVARMIFLVGDATPHDDYTDEPPTLTSTARAVKDGIVVNAIQCGSATDTQAAWQSIAQYGGGSYFDVPENGGVTTIVTPYDRPLADLGRHIGSTYLAYGGGAGESGVVVREKLSASHRATELDVEAAAPVAATADRAVNKAINPDAYRGDLISNLADGSVKMDSIQTENLPKDLQKLPTSAWKQEVQKRLDERKALQAKILSLSRQRDAYLAANAKKQSPKTSLDEAILAALKKEAAVKGIHL